MRKRATTARMREASASIHHGSSGESDVEIGASPAQTRNMLLIAVVAAHVIFNFSAACLVAFPVANL